MEAKGPRHVEVPREQRKYDRNQHAKPEESRSEQEVVVSIDVGDEPSWGDDRIDGLEPSVRTIVAEIEKKGGDAR